MGCKNKFKEISFLAQSRYGFEILDRRARDIVNKWLHKRQLADQIRTYKSKLSISIAGMLAINSAL